MHDQAQTREMPYVTLPVLFVKETAELLESAMRDLQAELDKRGVKQPADIEPASSGLKDALLKFESEHPQLSDAVGKVADALAAMGI